MSSHLVIIPTYNEKENAELILRAVFSLEKEFHVLIVDDDSPDGTADVVKSLQDEFSGKLFLLTRKGKLGLGTAYIEGFKFAITHHYDFVYEMDADFSHQPSDLLKLRKACSDDGYEMAIGSRYKTGVNVVNWPMMRVLMSFFASKYVRIVTGMPIEDATAGFVCYKREVLETINLDKIKFIGYAFQIEMKFKTWKHGFKMVEVPIIFINRERGVSKMSSKIFSEAVFGIMKMKFYSLFNKYENSPKSQRFKKQNRIAPSELNRVGEQSNQG